MKYVQMMKHQFTIHCDSMFQLRWPFIWEEP